MSLSNYYSFCLVLILLKGQARERVGSVMQTYGKNSCSKTITVIELDLYFFPLLKKSVKYEFFWVCNTYLRVYKGMLRFWSWPWLNLYIGMLMKFEYRQVQKS